MAKTKSSVRGTQNKKIVVVKPYKRSDGTKVGGHRHQIKILLLKIRRKIV